MGGGTAHDQQGRAARGIQRGHLRPAGVGDVRAQAVLGGPSRHERGALLAPREPDEPGPDRTQPRLQAGGLPDQVGQHDRSACEGGRDPRGLTALSVSPVLGFDEQDCENPDEAGGKGAGLAKMTRLGMPVPPGFVVRASVLAGLLDATGARERVLSHLEGAADNAAESSRAVLPIVKELRLPADFTSAVVAAFDNLSSPVGVAVRSSACAEDSEAASFAGQQETFLNVRGKEEVLTRIKDCWASFFSERALFYRSRKGNLSDLGMAAVGERQLAPDRSRGTFTIDPVPRPPDQMIILAVLGLR